MPAIVNVIQSQNGSNHQLSLIAGENRRYSPENPVWIFVTKL